MFHDPTRVAAIQLGSDNQLQTKPVSETSGQFQHMSVTYFAVHVLKCTDTYVQAHITFFNIMVILWNGCIFLYIALIRLLVYLNWVNLLYRSVWPHCPYMVQCNTVYWGYSAAYSTSLGCRRQPSLACHAWNHGKSPKSSPLSQQCRFHCHTWSAGESHYCVNSKGFMKFGTHTNEESDEYQQKWLPLSEFVGLCSKYIAIPYGSMAFILKNLPFQITRCF